MGGEGWALKPELWYQRSAFMFNTEGVCTNIHFTPFLALFCRSSFVQKKNKITIVQQVWSLRQTFIGAPIRPKHHATPDVREVPPISFKPPRSTPSRGKPGTSYSKHFWTIKGNILHWALDFFPSFHSFHVPLFCAIAQAQVRVNQLNWCKLAKMALKV